MTSSTFPENGTDPRRLVEDLRTDVEADLIVDTDPGYDDARRVWNGMIDHRPLLIVRARATGDIAPTLALAARHRLPLAVRGGGHNVAGNGTVDAGIVLDLAALNTVEVDPDARTVRALAGATMADIDRATEPYGLAVPLGVVSATGIAGLTLGGGVGWQTRAHGLTLDAMVAADVVTVAGTRVRASATENPELFWGLRGGGGNFGVVSSFTFRAHPLPPRPVTGNFVYPKEQWAATLAAYDEWTRDLPDELTSILSVLVPPPAMGLGSEPLMLLGFAWAGTDTDRAREVIDRMRRAAPPAVEADEPMPWTAWQSAVDGVFPKGVRGYWKNTSFDSLDPAVIDTLLRRGAEQTWLGTAFDIHHMGGAFARVAEDDTPFPNRGARFWLNIYGFWTDPADDAERVAFVREFGAEMAVLGSGGTYVNFLGAESGTDPVAQALAVYGPAKLERLAALKREYDPENLLRLNHNIPTTVTRTGSPGDTATGDTQ
ncbi:FAD-linked oxidoreductase [Cryobacterium sp. LW097]|uniref:FAD-binding oxidoreductase n=1 Tax=Cryobacterium sp. LW097 TaxID=1978566 RepID=UPI000B4D76D0|nr:FAD-binding oxidoreductase [Cryobacterium sp. LW097]ASD22297.1 FAD-linked oxidoreductase [Cryobacterium sp. LW097]